MKIKNILALVCFLCIGVSCSMEDDILNDVDTKGSDNITVSETYASMTFSLYAADLETRTKASSVISQDGTLSDMTDNEISIYNCFIAVYEYDNSTHEVGSFLSSSFYEGYKEVVRDNEMKDVCIYNLGGHIIFKIPTAVGDRKDLKIVAIAQTTQDGRSWASEGEISYADLKAKELSDQPNTLVKVGECEILKGEDGTYVTEDGASHYVSISSNVLDLDADPLHTSICVPVYQRSAAVMLDAFKIKNNNGEAYADVKITNVRLINSKISGKVDGEAEGGDNSYKVQSITQISEFEGWGGFDTFNKLLNGGSISENVTKDQYRIYAYHNTNPLKKTALEISYTYNNGEIGKCEFTIKSPKGPTGENIWIEEIWADYLYKLDVTVTNATVDVKVKCATLDWVFDETHQFEFKVGDK